MFVEVLKGTYDFQGWFHKLEAQFQGLTPTTLQEDVNHVWQFVRRSIAEQHYDRKDIECSHEAWIGLDPDPALYNWAQAQLTERKPI